MFVNFCADYDTINHWALLFKVSNTIKNPTITKAIQFLLCNRHSYSEMYERKSQLRRQQNGLPQDSVFSPILFDIHLIDEPEFFNTRRFIYADDLGLANTLSITTNGTLMQTHLKLNSSASTLITTKIKSKLLIKWNNSTL